MGNWARCERRDRGRDAGRVRENSDRHVAMVQESQFPEEGNEHAMASEPGEHPPTPPASTPRKGLRTVCPGILQLAEHTHVFRNISSR